LPASAFMRRVAALSHQIRRQPAAAAAAAAAAEDASAAQPPAVIDTHTHFYDPTRADGVPWPTAEEDRLLYRTVLPDDFMAVAGPCGVTGTVIVEASPRYEDNAWVLEQAERHHCIVGLCGSVQPNRPEFAAEIRNLAANPLFRGIRVGAAPADQPASGGAT
jgi:L-fuconolactonase